MLCCVWKKPYNMAEPWTCETCGVTYALQIKPQRTAPVIGHRARAVELLDILASQPEWVFGVFTLPGYGPPASRERRLANQAMQHREVREWSFDRWRDAYANAAELIRTGYLDGETTVASLSEMAQALAEETIEAML